MAAVRQPAELQGASLEPGEEMKNPGGGAEVSEWLH